MMQEDKQLLLVDLCGRLPYGVIVRHADSLIDSDGNDTGQFWYKRGYLYDVCKLDDMTTTIIESEGSDEEGYEHICFLERTLPYLRPMSSMTVEEKEELLIYVLDNKEDCKQFKINDKGAIESIDNNIFQWVNFNSDTTSRYIDWLNKKMFDYHGLIEKGLAIEAPDNMYKEKQQ